MASSGLAVMSAKVASLPPTFRCSRMPQRQARVTRLHAQPSFEYSPSISVSESSSGTQLTCTAAVEKGEVLVTVPEEAWLDCSTVTGSSIGSATAAETNDPEWGAYLDEAQELGQLPPVVWGEEELQELQGTQVAETVMQYRQYFADQHSSLAPVLEAIGGSMPQACTLERFMLAAAVVRARLLPDFPMNSPSLIPGLQSLSHRRNQSVKIVIKQGLFNKKKSLMVAAARDLSAGDVLSVDMAPGKLESQALLDYGVFDVENPKSGYLLQLSLPDEDEDRCYYDKEGILEDKGLATAQSFTLAPREAPPENMLAFLRLMNVQGPDAFLMESIFRRDAWGFMLQPVSRENEQAVCDSMVAGCEAAVAGYATSLAEDLRVQASMKDGDTSSTALALRAEKEVLEGVMEWFRKRLEGLDGLEYYQERRLKGLGLLDDDGQTTFEDMVRINI